MSQPLSIIIVEKNGTLKSLAIKDFKVEELFKKCGFKKGEDFIKQVEWNAKYDGKKYFIEVYAKTDGRANSENKYDFPPPIDNKLFFGSCAIVAKVQEKEGADFVYVNLTIDLWNKIYEKLFGGFEDLVTTAKEDEDEIDELALIPKEKKTKDGYLKDGFVVDSSDPDNDDDEDLEESDDFEEYTENTEDYDDKENTEDTENIGSELSEESYI
jgi:hypothetical protein